MKRPSFQFYPADWRKDAALQSCSMAAQGLWINLLCVMHECEPYGHLVINGNPMQPAQIARLVGMAPKESDRLMNELDRAGVLSYSDGFMFSRRMVRDEHLRNVRAEAGKLGGNPNLVGRKDKQKDKQTSNQTPTPSSSSSSSSSEETSVAIATGGKPPPEEIVFGYGVPLLMNAGSQEKQARSFLGKLLKEHGPTPVVDALRDCLRAKPLQPLEWLAAALPPKGKSTNRQEAFEDRNRAVGDAWVKEHT